ncbi:hypothetical protein ACFLUB_00940 [Chloroflexota bacterium]
MARRVYTSERLINKLREAELQLQQGTTIFDKKVRQFSRLESRRGILE